MKKTTGGHCLCVGLLFFFVLTTFPANAADGRWLSLTGSVLDETGAPVSAAAVQLMNAQGVILREARTAEDGTFTFEGLTPNDYLLQARTLLKVSRAVEIHPRAGQPLDVALHFGEARPTSQPEKKPSVQQLRAEMLALQQRMTEMQKQFDRLTETRVNPATVANTTRSKILSEPSPQARDSSEGLYTSTASDDTTAGGQQYPAGLPGQSALGGKVKIGGYGSFRYEANSINPAPRIGNLPQAQNSHNSFDFRRFVLTVDATPTERLRFYTEIEFERLSEIEIERTALPENRGQRDRAGIRFLQEIEGTSGSELAVEQAWAQFNFNDAVALRMGVILPPVGRFNINHDDDGWDVPRRSLVDRGGPVLPVKAAWSELGAGLLGNIRVGDGYFDYQFYIVNGAQLDFTLEEVVSLREGRNLIELEPEIAFSSGPFNGTNTADALTWRTAFSPRPGHEIAFSGYHGEYTPDYLNVNSWINTLAVDGKTTLGRFEIEGEFVYSDFGRMEAVLGDIARQAVDAAAKTSSAETAELETEVEAEFAGPLTNQRYGFWVDFKYRFWPRALDESFLGRGFENPQLIPIVRFEQIWFNDFVNAFDFSGGVITDLQRENLAQQRTTLGLTYRPAPTVAFSAAWEYNRRTKGSRMIFPNVLGLGRLPDKSFNALILGMAVGF